MKLRVAVANWDPISIIKYNNNEKISIEGKIIQLFNIIISRLNMSYEFYQPYDGSFGIKNQFGHWNGIVGLLEKNECDIGITPVSRTKEREEVVNFSYDLFDDDYRILTNSNYLVNNDLLTHFMIIDFNIWILLMINILLLIIIKLIINFVKRNTFNFQEITNLIFNIIAIILQQSLFKSFRKLSLFSWLMSLFALIVLILFICINALIGVKIITEKFTTINDVNDLVRDKSIIPVILNQSVIVQYLRDSKNEQISLLWERIINNNDISLLNKLENQKQEFYAMALKEGKIAFIHDKIDSLNLQLYYCNSYNYKWTFNTGERILSSNVALPLNKKLNSEIKKKIHDITRRIVIFGLMHKWLRSYKSHMGINTVESCLLNNQQSSHKIIRFQEIKSPLILLFWCFFISTISLIAEIILKKLRIIKTH